MGAFIFNLINYMLRQFTNNKKSALLTQREQNGPYFYRNGSQSKYSTSDLIKSKEWDEVINEEIIKPDEEKIIKKKNYQVLAYIDRHNSNIIYTRWHDGNFKHSDSNIVSETELSKRADPLMVNDLVNNRIFRLNDIVSTYTQDGVRIISFDLRSYNCVAILDTDKKAYSSVIIYNIQSLISRDTKSVEKEFEQTSDVVFITADKKKLYSKSTIIYGIKLTNFENPSYNSMSIKYLLSRQKRTPKNEKCLPGWFWFANKEDRDTFFKNWQINTKFENQKVFSLKDLEEIINKNPKRTRGTLLEELIQIRKKN